jgi:hypothetical protein
MPADRPLVHQDLIELEASPAQVLEFVMTPERILNYYSPDAVECGVVEPGRSFWCRSPTAISLLEKVDAESTDDRVVLLVTTALGLEPPYTAERIREGVAFTMVEDWAVAPTPHGTTLTKSWRDVEPKIDLPFPLEDSIREAANLERVPLIERWNLAARNAT